MEKVDNESEVYSGIQILMMRHKNEDSCEIADLRQNVSGIRAEDLFKFQFV